MDAADPIVVHCLADDQFLKTWRSRMSREAIDAFFTRLAEDEELQRSYGSAMDLATRQSTVELAAAHGFEFTAAELGAAMEEQSTELSEDELENVAGGSAPCIMPGGRMTGDRSLVLGGFMAGRVAKNRFG